MSTTHQWQHHDAFHQRCTRCALLKRFEDFEGNPRMPNPIPPHTQCVSTGRIADGFFVAVVNDGCLPERT